MENVFPNLHQTLFKFLLPKWQVAKVALLILIFSSLTLPFDNSTKARLPFIIGCDKFEPFYFLQQCDYTPIILDDCPKNVFLVTC